MTVIDMDLEAVDAYAALKEGYDYGQEHVVKATLTIETIWIHAWIKPWMPATVRTALGVPADPAPAEAAEGVN